MGMRHWAPTGRRRTLPTSWIGSSRVPLLRPLPWLPFPLAGAALFFVANPLAVWWWARWAFGGGALALAFSAGLVRRGWRSAALVDALVVSGFFGAAIGTWLLHLQVFRCSDLFIAAHPDLFSGRGTPTCSWAPVTWLAWGMGAMLGASLLAAVWLVWTRRS